MRHYLDHASTSELRPEAREAVVAALGLPAGDPGRIHDEAMAARVRLEQARDQVAGLVGCRAREVVFTSGATESIVAATWGAVRRHTDRVPGVAPRVALAAVEHSAVREAATTFASDVDVVGVDGTGRLDVAELLAAVDERTALVHVQWANHEVGTLQPVAEVVAACRERGVLVHVDAAQAVGHVAVAFDALGADLLSCSAHKLGGPAGVGALLVRRGLRIPPLLVGGDQERARRAGLEPVAAIAGFGAACEALAGGRLDVEAATARRLTGRVVGLAGSLDGVPVYGDPDLRAPHLVCLGIEGVEPQAVLLGLDRAGIAAHSGSACSSESLEPSPVLRAMGVDAHRSLRISVGWSTGDADIDALEVALPRVLAELRALGG